VSTPPGPVVIDASVWVGFFLTSDSTHGASYNWIDRHTSAGGMLVAPSILLTEVAAAIARRLGQPQTALHAAVTISNLNLMRIVPMDGVLIQAATDIAANLRLRGADAIYVATAKQLGIPLLTWDHEQLTKSAGVILTIRP
jgi:predicted nucleic acid-binding protein